MEVKFHHVGYATKSIAKSLIFFQMLGYEKENSIVTDKNLGVRVQFLVDSLKNGPRIELVEDLIEGINHPIRTILSQRPGSYHFAYLIDSIHEFSTREKLRALTACNPAEAFDGRHVQFFMSRDEGIIELISNKFECECKNHG